MKNGTYYTMDKPQKHNSCPTKSKQQSNTYPDTTYINLRDPMYAIVHLVHMR